MEKNRGITLVVLIVTIVVMLILLSVGTKVALDGKLFGSAQKAVGDTNNKIGEQEYRVNGLMGELDDVQDSQSRNSEYRKIKDIVNKLGDSITKDKLKDELDKAFGEGKTEIIETDEGYTILVKETEHEFEVDKDGNVTANDNLKLAGGDMPGEGTEENPFKIYCIEDLILFSNNVNNGTTYDGKFVTLENDLNFNSFHSYNDYSTIVDEATGMTLIESMTSNTGFTPIGTDSHSFKGTFDGKNHKIYNLFENRGNSYAGLFGYIGDASIKNLTMININLRGNNYIGGIAAFCRASSRIQYCGVEGNIKILNGGSDETISGKIGLIAGYVYGGDASQEITLIERCYSIGNLTKDNGGYFGGIVGEADFSLAGNKSSIRQCYNKMDLQGIGWSGGIAGVAKGFIIEECFHIGNCDRGIVSSNSWDNNIIRNCYQIGDIGSKKTASAAGIADKGNTSNSYSVGKLESSYCGGIILGMNYGNHLVHCFGRRGDWGNLPDGELTKSQILNNLSSYNNNEYGWKENAKMGDYCNVVTDEYMKSQAFVDELNTLIEASIEDGHVGEISTTQQNVWKRDVNNINQGYPIFVWQ